MDSANLPLMTVSDLAPLLARRDLSPVEVVEAQLSRIERLNPQLNAYLTILADSARDAARQAEQAIIDGNYLGPWHGIPIAVKDLLDSRGIRTTYGSTLFTDHIPDRDATSLARLTQAGAILLGKLNLHEFATGGDPYNPHFGLARNPWNAQEPYSSGGSSGGSAVATSAGLAMATLGTDTGGSVRIPASLCGIVGLKPTYGRVSRAGVWPVSWSMDSVGPMTRSVSDCALMLQAIAGYDPADPSTSREPVPDFGEALQRDVRGLRAGVVQFPSIEAYDTECEQATQRAYTGLEALGLTCVDVSIPLLAHSSAIYTAIVSPDAYSVHAELLKTHGDAYGPSPRQRYTMGALIPAHVYLKAQRLRTVLTQQMTDVLRDVDILVTPGTPFPAFSVAEDAEETVTMGGQTVSKSLVSSAFTHPFNLSGMPALVLPSGFSERDLPLSLQIAGRPFSEDTLFAVGHAYEQHAGWFRRQPPLDESISQHI